MTAVIVVAIVVGVIAFLLSIPLELSFYLGVRERLDFHVSLGWFFSLVKKEFGRQKKQAKKRAGRGWTFFDLLRIRGLLPNILRLLKDAFRRIRIRDLRVDFRVGLDDPADTVLFIGSLWLPVFLLGLTSPYAIRLQPSFDNGPVFQGYAYVVLRLRPIQLVPAIVRFGCSRAALSLLAVLVSDRWKRKK